MHSTETIIFIKLKYQYKRDVLAYKDQNSETTPMEAFTNEGGVI